MFLKRLETIGFKSFAERITIEFVSGITTIVGPNGSGKSNIIDAIRWVLGEQSARSLRGQRMEDIIFQGSDTRNPLNFAEVTLVLNNENGQLPVDYQEVEVTRRVYRSGESEFLINKQACRLKDIVDLFTDTGLGRESFSIIGQGKIDEILSSKADERRAVFEEAAGVMRYKRRKEQAAFKLAETEDNLSRVEDIIHEITQQLEPLKKQATVAKQYKELHAELTEKEIALLVTEIDKLHREWNDLLKVIDTEKMTHLNQQTKLQQFEASIIEKREQSEQLETNINSLQQRLLNVTELLEQTEGKRNVLLEQQKHREENKRNLLLEKNQLLTELNETNERAKAETNRLTLVDERLQQLRVTMSEMEEKLYDRHEQITEEIEELKSDYIELLNDKAVLKNESNVLFDRNAQVNHSLEHHEHNHADLKDRSTTIAIEFKRVKIMLEEQKSVMKNSKREIERIHANVQVEEKKLEKEQNSWYQINDQITKLSSRKEMLIEMKKNFQGFAYGVKEILQANKRGILHGIIGPVIDVIDVPSRYMIAIDTILGAQAQYVVVPNDDTARMTIEWLKKENKGRATFLPLQSIVARFLPNNVRTHIENEHGFIGVANELVDVKSEYKQVADHLMGNVIVTETLQAANSIAQKTNRRYRIVTLDGDVVFPGGSISGGAQRKKNFSLFTREKEIDELTKQIKQYHNEKNTIKTNVMNKQTSIAQMKQTVNEKTEQLTTAERKYHQLLNKQNEYTIKGQSIDDQMTAYTYQKNEYTEEIKSISQRMNENKTALAAIKQKIEHVEQTIETKTEEQQSLLLDKQTNEQKLHKLQLENAEQQERYKNHHETVISLKSTLKSIEQKINEVKSNLQEIAKHEQTMENVTSVENNIQQFREEREQVSEQIHQLQNKRNETLQTIEDESRELKSQQKLQEQFSKKLQEKEVEAGRLDVKLENRLQTLQKEYTITYEKAAQMYEKVTDMAEVREQVNQLKDEVRALGTVNLGAIDEYERLSERESFLNEQRDDLIEAKETLYNAIQQMDEEMISRFSTTFENIQAAFTVVFKQLFGGGYAELVLTEPDNYLETGIDIIARPPGKKLKTLELLSGGERALTAIALLFSILRARPVPFVILDEVDAALDEANVDRFAKYLKSFSEESQFVVISHRKGTMEEADALYGVTMQESGVSRFVSVRLEETDNLMKSS